MDWTAKGNGATAKLGPGIRFAVGKDAVRAARLLFKECASSLGFDLCFRDFARELAGLPGEYASPGGALLVAFCGSQPAGCVAMRPRGLGACEMKRLYVRHTWRGRGVERLLVENVAEMAHDSGYRIMRVEALPWMRRAIAGYRSLGFEPPPPTRDHAPTGTHLLELDLTGYRPREPRVVGLHDSIGAQRPVVPRYGPAQASWASDSELRPKRCISGHREL